MLGTHDGYEGFPSRNDLMSLNTIKNSPSPVRSLAKEDYRSLKTDDIAGARSKSHAKLEEPQYQGLNLPSYSKKPSPDQQYSKNAANFYGSTPPLSRSKPNDSVLQKAAARFFGTTPDQSAYKSPSVPNKASEGFFGVTPAEGTRKNYNRSPEGLNTNLRIPSKEAANFYGVTPPDSSTLKNLPPKAIADFFGATPENKFREPKTSVLSPQKKDQINSDYVRNAEKFYGATPQSSVIRRPVDTSPIKNLLQQNEIVPPNVASKFYGVTPLQSRSNNIFVSPSEKKSTRPPADAAAKFFGATPEQTKAYEMYNARDPQIPVKDAAGFFGVTPPQSRISPIKGSGTVEPLVPRNVASQFFGATPENNTRVGYSRAIEPARITDAAAAFYGSTPVKNTRVPREVEVRDSFKRVPEDVAAKFYGSTPIKNTRATDVRIPETFNRIPDEVAAKFYGSTPMKNTRIPNDERISGSNNKLPESVVAKFYGSTPQGPRDQYKAANGQFKAASNYNNQLGAPTNISPEFKYAAEVSQPAYNANLSKFYGVTPPQSQPVNTFNSRNIRLFT